MKKFWYVQSKNYDQMNSLVGSDLSDKDFSNINGSKILSSELYLVLLIEDGQKIWMTFPTHANEWLEKEGYVYQGKLSLKDIRKDKLRKIYESRG